MLQALQKLDLRGNAIASLPELAVLAGLPSLRDLQLEGGESGNPVCSVPGYRSLSRPGQQSVAFSPMILGTLAMLLAMHPAIVVCSGQECKPGALPCAMGASGRQHGPYM